MITEEMSKSLTKNLQNDISYPFSKKDKASTKWRLFNQMITFQNQGFAEKMWNSYCSCFHLSNFKAFRSTLSKATFKNHWKGI